MEIKKEIARLIITSERVTSEEVGEIIALLKNDFSVEAVDFGIFKISKVEGV
jgi:hypothetical protein